MEELNLSFVQVT